MADEDVVTRTFGYCPVVSAAKFTDGFAACRRLSTNYTNGGPVALADSITANVTNAAANPNRLCGLSARPQNLSCFFQVQITPFTTPGINPDLGYYDCAPAASVPQPSYFTVELIIAVSLVGLAFIVPNLWLLFIYLRRPAALAAEAVAEASKHPKKKHSATFSPDVRQIHLTLSAALVHTSLSSHTGCILPRTPSLLPFYSQLDEPPHSSHRSAPSLLRLYFIFARVALRVVVEV